MNDEICELMQKLEAVKKLEIAHTEMAEEYKNVAAQYKNITYLYAERIKELEAQEQSKGV